MSVFPADQLSQMSANAAAVERSSIYGREALWSTTTGELISQARQRRLDSWSDDGLFKTVSKAYLEGTGLYDAGPRSGGSAILAEIGDVTDFNLLPQISRMADQTAATMLGDKTTLPRDASGRVMENPDDAHRAITNRIADSLFYGAIHDPAFIPDDNMIARYGIDNSGEAFPQDTLLDMAKAGSEFEIAHIRAAALHQRDQERRMSRFAAPVQFAYGILGSLGDPTSFAVGALSGEVGGIVAGGILRTTSGTLARMAEGGFIARTASGFIARNTAEGLVPGVGFRAALSAGENIGANYALSNLTGDDYSWRQAGIDATVGVGFSTAGTLFKGAKRLIRGNERMTIADTGAVATDKSNFYFEEVPGHRPEATVADLASADASAAHMTVTGEDPVLPRRALVKGREVLTADGRKGRVVEVVGGFESEDGTHNPYQVLLSIDGKTEAHGVETVGIDRTRTPFVGDQVRVEDGTVGTIDRLEGENGDIAIVKSLTDATEHRVPTWLLDQREGEASVRKGVTAFDPQGRAVLAFLKGRDISTVAHETGHLFRNTLRSIDGDSADTLNNLFGETSDAWSVHSEEKFARSFETYLSEGKAPTPGLRGVFEHFKTWLSDLWTSLKGEAPESLTPELRAVMDKMLGADNKGGTSGFDRAGENYKRVRGEIIATLGKDGKHSPESSAMLALIHANAGAWSRGTGKAFDHYFTDVLVGVQKDNIGPDRFMRRMLPTNRRVITNADARYDYVKQRWEARAESAAKAKAAGEAGVLESERQAKIDQLASRTANDVDKNRWITAANRLQVEDPNVIDRPLSKDEYDAIIGELSLKRLSTASGIVTVVPGMNGHARLVDGKLEISPFLASLPAEQRLSMVRNAILARDIVLILGEEAWKGNPVPPPAPKALAAWMDRKKLMPRNEAGPVAAVAVNTMERMHNPSLAADTLIGGLTKEIPIVAETATPKDLARQASEASTANLIRAERASPHADQNPLYDAGFDPQFAFMYEQTGPTVGGKPTTAQPFKPNASDPNVFDYSQVIGGKIKGFIGKIDFIGRADHLSDSASKFVQDASAMLFDTTLRNENNARNATPSEIGVKQKVNAIFGTYLGKSETAFNDYAKANKMPLLQRSEGRIAFEREVGRLSSMPGKPSDPHLAAAVEASRAAVKDAHAIARANGVNLPDYDPAYFMRLWSAGRKATLIAKMDALGITDGVKKINALLAEATLKKRTDLTPAEAAALGETMNRRIDEVSTRTALDRMRVMGNLDNFDRTFNTLVKDGMDTAEAHALATKLTGSPTTGAQPAPTQGRGWVLDDRHSMTVQGPQGPFTFSVADLLETDAGTIVSHYSRAMVSEASITSVLRELSTRYGKSISSVDSLMREADAELAREPGMTSGKRQRQVKRLSTGVSLIKGLPTHETTGLTQTMQALQKFNYIRMQGGFVVSAAFELASMAARTSFGAMLKTMPLAREVYSQMKSGKIDGQVAKAILTSMGAGHEGQIRAYLPDLGERDATTGAGGRFLNSANKKLGQGQTAVSRLTFFEQLNDFSHIWARATHLQTLVDLARRDQTPNAKRLAQMGLNGPTWDAIKADIKKNATPSQGAGGLTFDVNLDGMDPLNRTRLLGVVDAKARELINEPTIGGSDYWLETPGMRMVNQFRQFSISCYQKQLLANIQNFDGESAAFFASTFALGTLQYTLLSYLDSRGADDPEEDFKRRVTLARLGYGGFARAAFSGIAPTLIDSALYPFGIKPLQGGRTTGQSGYGIANFPTQQLFTEAIPGLIGLARSTVDPTYDASIQDAKGARSLLPLARFPGVTGITNSFMRDAGLPKKPQKEQTDILKMLDGQ